MNLAGKNIIEPQERDARWFIYRLAHTRGDELKTLFTIRSLTKLTGDQLLQRVRTRMKPKKPRPKPIPMNVGIARKPK